VQGTSRLACARQVQSKAGEGLAWVRRQIECTQLQFWGSARANTAWSWCLRLQTHWGSSKIREMSRYETQQKSTPMKCEAAVAILASEGLALVSVNRQHARSSFVLQCTFFLSFFIFNKNYALFFLLLSFSSAFCLVCSIYLCTSLCIHADH